MGMSVLGIRIPVDLAAVQADIAAAKAKADAAATAAAAAQATGDNARQMVLNRDPAVATLTTDVSSLQALANSVTALNQASVADRAALHAQADALAAAVAALQALKVLVGYGVANLPASLAAGQTTNVTVTLSRNMGSTTYSVGYGLAGGTSLLGQLTAVGVTAQTATTVTVQVKNTGLTALLNLSTASLSVVAARDAA